MVSPDTLRTGVGILGNIIALALFLSPVPTFVQICKKGSVEQFSPVPYLATLLNCMFWVLYGLPMVHPHSMLVITINGTGFIIELAYVLLFIFNSEGKKRMRVIFILIGETIMVGFVGILVMTVAHTHEKRSLIVGCICVVFGTMMYVAPLSVMKLVITTRSVEYMPFFLSFASFANGVCWTTYALIRFDLFITVPNGIGTVLALLQLILYATFYKSTQRQLAERKRKGEVGLSEVVVGDSKKIANAPQNGHEIREL
ncbi:Bidirectional sugar transporter sweet4 [Ranunculus cassubicifolius]